MPEGPERTVGAGPPPPRPVQRLLLARPVRRDLHLPHAPRHVRAPDRRRGRRRRARSARRAPPSCLDLDMDGRDEVRLADAGQVVTVKPSEGAGIGGWDIRAARHALAAVLRRRPEAYHETLRAHEAQGRGRRRRRRCADDGGVDLDPRHRHGQGGGPGGPPPLRRPRAALGPRPLPRPGRHPRGRRDGRRGGAGRLPRRRVAGGPPRDRARSRCRATAPPSASRFLVSKTIRLAGGRLDPQLVVELELHHRGGEPIETRLGLELSLHVLGGGGNPSAWYDVRGERSAHDGTGEAAGRRGHRLRQRLGRRSRSRRGPSRRPMPGGAPSRRSPIPNRASSASTRAVPCCSPGPPGSSPARPAGSPSASEWPWRGTGPRRNARDRDARRLRPGPVGGMSRPRLVVHAHFYQPFRTDPFTGHVPPDPSAAPFRDWNERVTAECYRPNAERGHARARLLEPGPDADRVPRGRGARTSSRRSRRRTGVAAARRAARASPSPSTTRSCRSRRSTTAGPRSCGACATSSSASGGRRGRCGCRRRPSTSRRCASWPRRASRRRSSRRGRPTPTTSTTGGRTASTSAAGRHITVAVLRRRPVGGGLVRAGGDGRRGPLRARAHRAAPGRLAARRRARRCSSSRATASCTATTSRSATCSCTGSSPRRRRRRTAGSTSSRSPRSPRRPPATRIPRSGSATGPRGAATTACCAGPASARTRRTAAGRRRCGRPWSGSPAASTPSPRRWPGSCPADPDIWAARDATWTSSSARGGATRSPPRCSAPRVVRRRTGGGCSPSSRRSAGASAMFASCGWFWEEPFRPETRQVLRSAARAVRLVDGLAGTNLERRLVADLATFVSPGARDRRRDDLPARAQRGRAAPAARVGGRRRDGRPCARTRRDVPETHRPPAVPGVEWLSAGWREEVGARRVCGGGQAMPTG